MLDLEKADEDELYNALDWLLEKQEKIEKHLAIKHFSHPESTWVSLKILESAVKHLGQPQDTRISHETLWPASWASLKVFGSSIKHLGKNQSTVHGSAMKHLGHS